jgi:CTP synthase (UTP-ammonia lyase)
MNKLYLYGALIIVIFVGGWQSRSWYEDSKDLAEKKATEKAEKKFRAEESEVARYVESKLQELRANERIIERHHTKVVSNPVYRNVCTDADGLRLINSYATGTAGKLVEEVPTDTTEGGRDDGG